ncbi:MAG TPA: tRNA uridine-5-carboxymethylaminomethyl(34) synthesis GTPase MnmE [Xanthobacteraceae bacterium]|nr:tRNA uridine-5-carboxymethylaminomethyl(34) synthesis GTPase MnmE [Xanthobacteraceae bacterium]
MEKRPPRPPVSDDTIYALSSGRVPSAIAVVRISGPKARIGLETIAGTIPEPRRASRATFREPASGDVIDDGLVLWFPAPGSETGEDVAELHLHGGRAILSAVFQVFGAIDGFRPAQAGEFTRRALANNKLDLAAVEGLGDLVAAETAAQRRQAMAQYRGALSREVEAWRARLIEAMSLVEAAIDFSDEGDVPQNLLAPAAEIARELGEEIKRALDDGRRGERLRDGFVVAIAGAPNVGKSTLLNRLAAREVAIVSALPGTTRDAIEVALDLAGVPVVLVDTAGVRDTSDPVEAEGVRRALARAQSADLVLWLIDASGGAPERAATSERSIEVWTKSDVLDSEAQRTLSEQGSIRISAKTGAGMDELIALLAREASALAGEPALVTRERQRHALKEAVERLGSALQIAVAGQEELFAEELRLAARALGRVTGAVGVEEVLDAIFRNFCVGK